jgi:hypothetical protein
MNLYDIDTQVVVASAFVTLLGVAIDPTTVTLYILDPSGIETVIAMIALTHAGTGVYTYAINANKSGAWTYKFQGAGNLEVTSPDTQFWVNPSRVIVG